MSNMRSVRRLTAWYLGIFIGILLFTAFTPTKGETALVPPESREMKLLLKTNFFADRATGYQKYWSIVKEVAAEQAVGVQDNEDPFTEEVKKVTYYDTRNMDLTKNDYILRQRIKITDGKPASNCDLTLKYRTTGRTSISSDAVKTAEPYQPSISFQEDYVGYLHGVVGKAESEVSLSHTIKKIPVSEGKNLGYYATYFPVLATLGIQPDEPLHLINGVSVREYKVSPGELDFGGMKGEVAISLWFNYETGDPITAEISWECPIAPSAAAAKAEVFFKALQTKTCDLLYPGQMKTRFIINYKK